MPKICLPDAAATPWSAASFSMGRGQPTVLFDHQLRSDQQQSHSILLTEPSTWLVEHNGQWVEGPSAQIVDDPVAWMKAHHVQRAPDADLPFVGGIAGYLGFEFGWSLDRFQRGPLSSNTPDLWVGEFGAAAIFDHGSQKWTVVGRSNDGVGELADLIAEAPPEPMVATGQGARRQKFDISAEEYHHNVQTAVDAIYGGAFFEVNYTERFSGTWRGDRRALYEALRLRAPGGFGGLVDVPEVFVASISPEQFLCVDATGHIRTRPIKGTRPRAQDPDRDQKWARSLVESKKDRAENIMIVDLMRNDLSRVCRPGSVKVTELCALHSFESVHHLISTVEGQLASPFCALDAFVSSFPAGSITGAPKLRSMEWIAAHERTARGPYTGSMFYWSDHGRLDSNVLIRTAVLVGERVDYGTGGAVVADSTPEDEYEEALWKAAPFFQTLEEQ